MVLLKSYLLLALLAIPLYILLLLVLLIMYQVYSGSSTLDANKKYLSRLAKS
jgi:hypothetical protein